jgi:NitT/TauT family transport system substrate-binding protein
MTDMRFCPFRGLMTVKKRFLVIPIFLILFAAALFFLLKPGPPEKVERLRVGVFADTICALVYVAQEQGFIKRHGLDLTIENYQAGTFAVNDLLSGKNDVATASEYVLSLQGFKRKDLRAIGTISTSEITEVVARRDRGIKKPEDLKGKLIGFNKGTANAFYLSAFLSFNNIHPEEIRTVDLKPAEMAGALSEGRVDAVISYPPFLNAIKKTLAGSALSWQAQAGRDLQFLLITTEGLVKTRPEVISAFLKGLLEAEAFLKKHERDGQEMMKRLLGIDQEAVTSTWSKTRFRVRLDQNLLTLMEDEGRWAIKNGLVEAERIPNYSTYLYLDGLKRIKPEAVGVSY